MAEIRGKQIHSQITVAECAYYAYFLVMFGVRAIGLYEGMLAYNIALVLGMMLFGLKVMLTRHTVSEYLAMGILLLISGIVYMKTGEKGLLLYMTMMLGMKDIPIRRIFAWAALIMAIAFPLTCVTSIMGIGRDNIFYAEKIGMGFVARHSLGYPVHNTAFTTYIILVVLVMYVLGKMSRKKLLYVSLAAFIGAVYVYLYTVSYTGMLVAVLYLVLNYYFQTRKTLSGLEKLCVRLVYPVCILFSVLGPLLIKGKLFDLIDKVLNNRWNYARYFLANESVTLFGSRFQEAPNGNYMIDSSFLYSFLQIGLIAFVVLTVMNMAIIHHFVMEDKRVEIAIFVSFCVLAISDPFFFNLSYKNLLFLFMGELLFRNAEKREWEVPQVLQREIQWFKVGSRTFCIDNGLFVKLCDCVLTELSRKVMVFWAIAAVILSGIYFLFTWKNVSTVIVDNVEKWEYIREGISVGFWGAVAAVILLMIYQTVKTKSGVKNEQ